MRPRLLDLFCCEGGAAFGYDMAGFDIVGVDIAPRFAKRYPYEFVAADAIEYAKEHAHEFDVIHASPPCQRRSAGTRAVRSQGKEYPDFIPATRDVLVASGKPYVIENVPGAPLVDPLTLCGTEFGLTARDEDGTMLELWRHRMFESNVPLVGNGGCQHGRYAKQVAGSYGGARRDKAEARNVRHGGYVPAKHVQEALLGIRWMTQYGLYQSLPPLYTRHVGRQLRAAL